MSPSEARRRRAPLVGAPALLLAASLLALLTPAAPAQLDPARIAELAALLPAEPRGLGPPIDDREAWGRVAAHAGFADAIPAAESLLDRAVPELTDELYLDFSRTGNRTRWQSVARERHARVPVLALAECLEDRGRYLAPIEQAIRDLGSEKTWVMPAHDRSLANFEGRVREIDLMVAGESWNLATAAWWLGDRLSPEIRELLRQELERRTFEPFEGMVTVGKPRMWWLVGTNNWNAVCLAGVTGAALASIEPASRRALFVAAAEEHVQSFLRGFTSDGYCSEGLGYWNYGFGHYALLAETLSQATGGELDLMAAEGVGRIARFGRRMEIQPGVFPAFADCRPGTRPDPQLSAWLSRRLGFGWRAVEEEGLLLAVGPTTQLFRLGALGFPNSASARPPAGETDPAPALREWFPDAGILLSRSAPGRASSLAVALKGGHNAEHHNHNDVGSFVVAVGGGTPLVDPGGEVYTRRTFGSGRYESGVLNSLGHPVPRVAGKLQRTGRRAAARILEKELGPETDRLMLDLAPAYDVDSLKRLVRTFELSREGAGSLRVIDQVELEAPERFETALITFSPWRQLAPDRLLVGEGPEAVRIELRATGGAVEIRPEEIHEDLPGGRVPLRLAIAFEDPVRSATLELRIAPANE